MPVRLVAVLPLPRRIKWLIFTSLLRHVGSGSNVARQLCSLKSNSQVQSSADENWETTFIKCILPA